MRRKSRRSGFSPALKWAILLAFVLLLILALTYLLTSPQFDLHFVSVSGNTVMTDAEIVAKVKEEERNLFRFSKRKLKKKLEALPGIRSVKIEKVLPDRLNIQIEESYMVGKTLGSPSFYVSNQGILFQEPEEGSLEADPLLPIRLPKGDWKEGDALSSDSRAMDTIHVLMQSEIYPSIEELIFDKSGNIDIMIRDVYVHFGPADNVYRKIRNLVAVMQEIKEKNMQAAEIILNEGENPIVVLKDRQVPLGEVEEEE